MGRIAVSSSPLAPPSKSGAEIVQLLEELRDEGRTVIVVTHDESLARRARRVIRLLDGRMVS